ncbi:hypothetical protein AB0L49_21630, partial [Streptomyces antimycoticus]
GRRPATAGLLPRPDRIIHHIAELGRLIEYDERHAGDLLSTLRHYLAAGNKSIAAKPTWS